MYTFFPSEFNLVRLYFNPFPKVEISPQQTMKLISFRAARAISSSIMDLSSCRSVKARNFILKKKKIMRLQEASHPDLLPTSLPFLRLPLLQEQSFLRLQALPSLLRCSSRTSRSGLLL